MDGFALGIVDEDGLQRLDEDAALQTNEYRQTPNSWTWDPLNKESLKNRTNVRNSDAKIGVKSSKIKAYPETQR